MPVMRTMARDQKMTQLMTDRKPSALGRSSFCQDDFAPGLVRMHDECRGKRGYRLIMDVGDVEPTAKIFNAKGQRQVRVQLMNTFRQL